MIRLAGKTWKVGTTETLKRLVVAQIGLSEAVLSPGVISDYERDYVLYPDRLDAFWKQCQLEHGKAATPELRVLQRKFNARGGDDWMEKGGQLLGSSTKMAVDKTLHPKKVAGWMKATADLKVRGYPSRIFTGPNWKDLLVLPFNDVPGRICGFLFIGRNGELLQGDYVYRSLTNLAAGSMTDNEAGLAMLSSLSHGSHPRLGNTGFCISDPHLAILLQMRHRKDRRRPRPIVASWSDDKHETEKIWDWLGHEDMICWAARDPIAAILNAKRCHGKVALLAVPAGELAANMQHYTPTEWLVRMKAAARSWHVALRRYLVEASKTDVEAAFLRLGMHGRDLVEFIQGCDKELRERLEHIEQTRTLSSQIKFESKWVFEKADGWYLTKGEDRICNAIVRIEQVLTTMDHIAYYRGTIKFESKLYAFTERANVLEKGMLKWAQSFIRDVCQAGVIEYYPSWNRKALQLALAFHKPTFAQGVEVIGWDDKERQFNFPKFSIRRGGEVTDAYACLFDNERVPAREVPVPGSLSRRYIEVLGELNEETAIYWAVTAAVTANLVAPAVNREPVGLLLDGEGAQAIGNQAASRLGCTILNLQRVSPLPVTIARQTHPHRWPTILAGQFVVDNWLDEPEARKLVTSFNWATNCVLASRGRWNMVRCQRKLGSMQLVQHAAPYVIPNYLQDLYRRSLHLPGEHTDLILDVLDDLAVWFRGIGGSADAVTTARSMLLTPGDNPPWQHFMYTVFRLHSEGELNFTKAGFDDARKEYAIVSVEGEAPKIWISQDRFSDAVRKVGVLPPDLLLITKSLSEAEVLMSEPSYRDARGWLVPEKWWNQQLETWRSA